MPPAIEFIVPMHPVAKGRPRVGPAGHAYTPAKTRRAEATFASLAAAHMPPEPLQGPLRVVLWFFLPVPPSWPKWRQMAALEHAIHPGMRPDLDNYIKLALDALEAFWRDDAQIVDLIACKMYERRPGTRVKIEELQQPQKKSDWNPLPF